MNEIQKIEDKVLSGYWYRNTPIDNGITLSTGKGGALELIKAYRETGIPEETIGEFIQVLTDNNGWVRLSDITIMKVEHECKY